MECDSDKALSDFPGVWDKQVILESWRDSCYCPGAASRYQKGRLTGKSRYVGLYRAFEPYSPGETGGRGRGWKIHQVRHTGHQILTAFNNNNNKAIY